MESARPDSIEEMLQRRMGVSVDDAVAIGADALDDVASRAVDAGLPVDQSLDQGLAALVRLAAPENVAALNQLIDALPRLVELVTVANQLPALVAGATDTVDELQPRLAQRGMDMEAAAMNSLGALLQLGARLDSKKVKQLASLLDGELLSDQSVETINRAATALRSASDAPPDDSPQRIGLFGLLRTLSDPQIQRSLQFAIRFAKAFGQSLGSAPSQPNT